MRVLYLRGFYIWEGILILEGDFVFGTAFRSGQFSIRKNYIGGGRCIWEGMGKNAQRGHDLSRKDHPPQKKQTIRYGKTEVLQRGKSTLRVKIGGENNIMIHPDLFEFV